MGEKGFFICKKKDIDMSDLEKELRQLAGKYRPPVSTYLLSGADRIETLGRQLAELRKDTERFQSVDPIEEWMEEQFPELWKDFKTHAKAFCEEGDARYFAMAFRNAMAGEKSK
jgi:hypothetical protein